MYVLSTSQLPKVVRTWFVFNIFTSKCAARHYFSALRSLKPLRKIHCCATFLPFRASAPSFFWLFLFSHLPSSISAFHFSILSEVWLLNFLRLIFRIIYNVCVTGKHYIYYDQLSPDIAPKHQGDTDIHPLLQGEVCPSPAQKRPGWRQSFWGWPLGEDVVERPVPVARRGTRVGGYNGGLNMTNGSMARQLAMPEW